MMRLPSLMPSFMRPFLMMTAAAVLVSACSGGGGEDARLCPPVSFVKGLDEMKMFDLSGARTDANMVYEAKLAQLESDCRPTRDGAYVEAKFLLLAERGPAMGQGGVTERTRPFYFVAVTDQENRIVTKQIFQAELPLSRERPKLAREEKIKTFLPGGKAQDLAGWQVLIGVQLTPEQAAYNRTKRP